MTLTKATYSMISGSPANILDFGADPTGTNDSAVAIQAAIDSGATAIYIPGGKYLISSTINFSQKRGIKIYGDAGGAYAPSPGSELIANSAISTMFNVYSSRECNFEDITFNGNNQSGIVGVKITSVNADGNTTNMYFKGINVLKCETCFEIGDGTVNQTSEITFIQCVAWQCTTGVIHSGDNTTGITWISGGFGYTDVTTAYLIRGGGSVQFHSCEFLTNSGGESILIQSAEGTNVPGQRVVPRSVDLFGCLTETPGYFISTENSPAAITGYPNSTQISLHGCRVWKPNNTGSIRLRTGFPASVSIHSCTFDGANVGTILSLASTSVQEADLYSCKYLQAQVAPTATNVIRVWGFVQTSYTPTWTASVSNPSIGNGSLVGTYKVIGNRCFATVQLITGSSTTLGSGTWRFSLPLPAAYTGVATTFLGSLVADNGIQPYEGITMSGSYIGSGNYMIAVSGAAQLTGTTPVAWAAGSRFMMTLEYDIA